jgi:hypothetical protein
MFVLKIQKGSFPLIYSMNAWTFIVELIKNDQSYVSYQHIKLMPILLGLTHTNVCQPSRLFYTSTNIFLYKNGLS